MPVLKLYLHGLTAGTGPTTNTHERGLRGRVQGWSNSSTRSNTRFLYAVEPDGLTGHGYALSLTLRDCPPSADDFHRVRRAFVERLRRMDMVRMHWLIEWQRRGVPHLHAAIWLPWKGAQREIIEHWCAAAGKYGALPWGQHVEPIHDAVGWFKYLSKHASRGLGHYQRSPQNVPKGWKGTTGRMWGRLGEWPLRPVMDMSLTWEGYHRLRRVVRGWRIADARKAGARSRIKAGRRMLRCHDRNQATVRGFSEWMPLDEQLRMLAWLSTQGFPVMQVES